MNTKEAIEKIKYWFDFYHDVVEGIHGEGTVEAMKQVEKALKRGEKFEKMIKELFDCINGREKRGEIACDIVYVSQLRDLKQKYFPEPKEKVIK